MENLTRRKRNILEILALEQKRSSSEIFDILKDEGEDVSLVTVKRDLSELVDAGYLERRGKGRATSYTLSLYGRLFSPVRADDYCSVPPDERVGKTIGYNFNLFKSMDFDLFAEEEYEQFEKVTREYRSRSEEASETIHQKEIQRFIIEFSWKSSRIEGNTYSLLDTERLIEDGIPAEGHTEEEARMILNHKAALEFIFEHRDTFSDGVNRPIIDEVHQRLMDGLGVETGFREHPVGITGTAYRPLDNKHQIENALTELFKVVGNLTHAYDRALLMILGISYIQPFADGNKRTARLMANAMLLAERLAPLSYRSTDEKLYKEATIVFYELQSLVPMKNIFIEQYIFASKNYSID